MPLDLLTDARRLDSVDRLVALALIFRDVHRRELIPSVQGAIE
jgi:hypothetical protein